MQKSVATKNAMIIGVILAAFAMRAPMGAVGPLVKFIQADYELSSRVAGLLTTIPLLTFAITAPLAGQFASRFRLSSVMMLGLLLTFAGCVLRPFLGTFGIFAGTVVMGTGIGILNVMQPGIIREHFPDQIGLLTGYYNVGMNLMVSIAAGISVPLVSILGSWNRSIMIWALVALIPILFWLPISRKLTQVTPVVNSMVKAAAKTTRLDKKFWLITAYMGLQAFVFFNIMAWLPSVMAERINSIEYSGYLMLLLQLFSLISGFIVPVLTQNMTSRTPIIFTGGFIYFLGLLVIQLSDSLFPLVLGCILTGFGTGACFSFALILIGLNGSSPEETARLAGFTQFFGYLVGAIGPFAIGALYDLTGRWTLPMITLMALCVLMIMVGEKAGGYR